MTTLKRPRRGRRDRETLVEHCANVTADARVRPGLIQGVKVLGLSSINNRRYLLEGVQKALHLYEGARVFIDHPMDQLGRVDPPRARKADEFFGRLKNVRMNGESMIADLHFLQSHPMAARVAEAAKHQPDAFGLSHNIEYTGRTSPERNGCLVVESITKVRSVDLVPNPATTKSLFEGVTSVPNPEIDYDPASDDQMGQISDSPYSDDGALGDPVDSFAEPVGSEELDEGFEAALIAVIKDQSLSPEDKLARLETLINAHADLLGGDRPDVLEPELEELDDVIDDSEELDPEQKKVAESFIETIKRRSKSTWMHAGGFIKRDSLAESRHRRRSRDAERRTMRDRIFGANRGAGGIPVLPGRRGDAAESAGSAAESAMRRERERREFRERLFGHSTKGIPEARKK